MNHEVYRVRPPVSKLVYALLLSLGITFVGWKFEERSYQIVGILLFAAFIVLVLQFIFPRQILLSSDHVIIPRLLPFMKARIEFREVHSIRVSAFKGTTSLYFRMRNNRIFSVPADSIERWEEFYSRINAKIPEGKDEMLTQKSPRLMMIIAAFVWLLMGVAMSFEFLNQQTALLVGGAATALILMGLIQKNKKK